MLRNRKLTVAVVAAAVAVLALALVPAPGEIVEVFVKNFPEVQQIEGTVSIRSPFPQASLVRLGEVIVSPVQPTDTLRLIPGGILETAGFGEVVLSLSGQVKGQVFRAGKVGALLLPEEEPVVRAFEEKGQTQFALEVAADGVSGASPYFASEQPRYTIGFSRYRVLFYNTSDKTVTVNLYAYMIQ